jgi:2-isopropylmalate synthase
MEILDTTLREGEQTPYVNFTVDEKIHIAKMLDQIGVDMIEAGDPSVSNNVATAIKRIASLGLRAEVVAHSIASRLALTRPKPAALTAWRFSMLPLKSIWI